MVAADGAAEQELGPPDAVNLPQVSVWLCAAASVQSNEGP